MSLVSGFPRKVFGSVRRMISGVLERPGEFKLNSYNNNYLMILIVIEPSNYMMYIMKNVSLTLELVKFFRMEKQKLNLLVSKLV